LSNRLGPRAITGVREIASNFRTWFVDVYGVLHDGGDAFPGAVDTLVRVRDGGGTVIIVTNSAQRVDAVARRLRDAGIPADAYDGIASSGELSWRYLERMGAGRPTLLNLFLLHESDGPYWIAHLPNPIVRELERAHLVIAAGMPHWTEQDAESSDLADILGEAQRHGLPLLVPDSDETYPQDGIVRLGPGWIARRYRTLGGQTIEFGKPYAPIFMEACRLSGAEPGTAIMVGDNLATDIAGAAGVGLASLLVLGGVHRDLSAPGLVEAMAHHAAVPSYVAARFTW
jgi:HAD superfamily hydrolase (TIGR01459 family)